jgi:starvation-inducible outer membrane lipoprotein
MRIAACATAMILAGCTTLPADPAKMTPEQLREYAKDRNASVTCVQARNATGTVAMISVSLDKAVLTSGSVVVKPSSDCEATITAAPKP